MNEGERLSRLLSYLLRHNPAAVGADVDREGWLSIGVGELAERISRMRGYEWVTEEDILDVVRRDERGRFEVRGDRIRATYGHSLPVDPTGEEVRDPPILYHGTTERAWRRISAEGILPMGRRFVHLTPYPEVALEVASRRRGPLVLLEVDAPSMARDGLKIWRASPVIYLAERVPPEYVRLVRAVRGRTRGPRG